MTFFLSSLYNFIIFIVANSKYTITVIIDILHFPEFDAYRYPQKWLFIVYSSAQKQYKLFCNMR